MVTLSPDQIPITPQDIQSLITQNPLAGEQLKVIALQRMLRDALAQVQKAAQEPCCKNNADGHSEQEVPALADARPKR